MNDHIAAAPAATSKWLASLPKTGEEPTGPLQDTAVPAARTGRFRAFGLSRRSLIQSGLAVASVTALNAFGRLPGFGIPAAYATVGTEYLDCANYDNHVGYSNNSNLCVGAAYSTSYCGSDGWFKNSTVNGTRYYYPVAICGNYTSGAQRNAWRWRHYVAGTSRVWRCADGYVRTSTGAYAFRICSYGF